jgi:hypothetical protein
MDRIKFFDLIPYDLYQDSMEFRIRDIGPLSVLVLVPGQHLVPREVRMLGCKSISPLLILAFSTKQSSPRSWECLAGQEIFGA